jgi:hypothetical protein
MEKDQEVFAVRDQDITIVYFIAQYEILRIAKRTNIRSQMDVKYFPPTILLQSQFIIDNCEEKTESRVNVA